MSEQDLAEMVQIAVEDLGQGDQTDVLDNHEDCDDKPDRKRPRVDNGSQDASLKTLLYSISQTICQRLDNMEAKLQVVEATCRALERKLDAVVNKNQAPIQVPMTNVIVSQDRPKGQEEPVARGADSLENLLSNTVGGRRQNTFLVKVPVPEDSQEDQESGSEASDSVSNSGQTNNAQSTQNVTLITLNSEDDYPAGTWLGDENNAEMRVRCPVSPGDMLHISTNCRTAEKMALTLLDYLFHREVQAISNLSGQGKHGKKQLDPLMIYGIRCHLFYKFGITESDWYRIKQSIDSKCRTAWRRKQRGQSLAGGAVVEAAQQTLHYTLANQAVQQVQIHRIGEDGQVQVIDWPYQAAGCFPLQCSLPLVTAADCCPLRPPSDGVVVVCRPLGRYDLWSLPGSLVVC
ncbi:unnamed protein product [Coregonus sp. 'balchen']|nr:unnamed protein product [Coregonus sp. 'balchen']